MMSAQLSSLSGRPASPVLRVQEIARARRFYAETLGLPTEDVPGSATEVRVLLGEGTSICLYERPAMSAPANTVACIEVPDLAAARDELRARGVVFEEYDLPEVDLVTDDAIAELHGERRAWFKDSEGNALVLREV